MKIICECGKSFETPDHDMPVSFAPETVVGVLGPGFDKSEISVSKSHACPHCEHGRYVAIALNATHFTASQRREIEKFLLRFRQPSR